MRYDYACIPNNGLVKPPEETIIVSVLFVDK